MIPQKPGGGCPAPVHGWSRLGSLHDPGESQSGSCPLQQCRTQKGVHRSSQMGVNLPGVDPRQIHGHFWGSPAPKKGSREAPKWPCICRGSTPDRFTAILELPRALTGVPRSSQIAVNLFGVDPRRLFHTGYRRLHTRQTQPTRQRSRCHARQLFQMFSGCVHSAPPSVKAMAFGLQSLPNLCPTWHPLDARMNKSC